MLDTIFRGIFDTGLTSVIAIQDFMLCVGCSLAIGLVLALMFMYRTRYTKSFVATLALLPAVVCVVIMMVNGNIGTGVAVAGAFSLVRFRSAPGTAKEIGAIFTAMGAGLIAGMGYLAYAAIFALLIGGIGMLYTAVDFGGSKGSLNKTLMITIPENLDYTDVFSDIFEKRTKSCELVKVKTTNMGSMFRLTYDITLASAADEKDMIDELRCRNGNLEISLSTHGLSSVEL
jgi:hypothetical protein